MSTDEYTPTLDEIAAAWVEIGRMRCRGTEGALRAVRRALAERDRQVAEQAWDEAVQALAWAMDNGPDPLTYVREHNPHRADSAALERRYPLGVSRSVVDAVEHAAAAPVRPTPTVSEEQIAGWVVIQEAASGEWRTVFSDVPQTRERAEEVAANYNALEQRVHGDTPAVRYWIAALGVAVTTDGGEG